MLHGFIIQVILHFSFFRMSTVNVEIVASWGLMRENLAGRKFCCVKISSVYGIAETNVSIYGYLVECFWMFPEFLFSEDRNLKCSNSILRTFHRSSYYYYRLVYLL